MNYSGISECDVLNGTGFRVSLFVSGCNKIPKCKFCQNSKAWDFNFGNKFTNETKHYLLDLLSRDYISGLSLLGGEVTDNLDDNVMFDLLETVKLNFPNKNIWAWTGYKIEELTDEKHKKFLSYIDILIDGEYDHSQRDLSRSWANSKNQRIINVKKYMKRMNENNDNDNFK